MKLVVLGVMREGKALGSAAEVVDLGLARVAASGLRTADKEQLNDVK